MDRGIPKSHTQDAHIHGEETAIEELETSEVKVASTPSEYYIQPKDTLVGIALRFGVDVSLSSFSVDGLHLNLTRLGSIAVPP